MAQSQTHILSHHTGIPINMLWKRLLKIRGAVWKKLSPKESVKGANTVLRGRVRAPEGFSEGKTKAAKSRIFHSCSDYQNPEVYWRMKPDGTLFQTSAPLFQTSAPAAASINQWEAQKLISHFSIVQCESLTLYLGAVWEPMVSSSH